MAQTAYPLPQTPATTRRWARMARVFAQSGVLGTKDSNPYGLTVSGLTVTIGRGTTGMAEAWVRGFMHTLDGADWSQTLSANTDPNPRIDRIVLRMDLETETVQLTRVQGTPAASPAVPALTQTDLVWDLPLHRFTVPGNSGAPLTSPVDDRYYMDVDTGWQGAATISADPTATWTLAHMQGAVAGVYNPQAAAWSPTLRLFAAVSVSLSSNQVWTSPDGVTWTPRTIPGGGTSWRAITWADTLGLFVAVSGTGNSTAAVATSPDGITWTVRTHPSNAGGFYAVAWSKERGLLVALASSPTAALRVQTSPDGITWTNRTLASNNATWNGITWADTLGLFVAVSLSSTATDSIATSPDGITWTVRTVSTNPWQSIAWSKERGLLVAVASDGAVRTSTDGITWTARMAPTMAWAAVVWASRLGVFVAVASDASTTVGPRVMVSPDGIAWSYRQAASDLPRWYGLAVGGVDDRTLLAVGTSTTYGGMAMRAAPATS